MTTATAAKKAAAPEPAAPVPSAKKAAEAHPTIFQALSAVMADVKGLGKHDKNNTPGAGFMFRGIDAVMNAVGPVLRVHGVIVVPEVKSVIYDKVTTSGGKPQTACRVQVHYTFYGPDGDCICTSSAGEAWDSGDKATPKAMSVAFRTCLLQTLCLPTDEPDPDATSYVMANPIPATKEQMVQIGEAFRNRGLETPEHRADFIKDTIGRDTTGFDLSKVEADLLILTAQTGVISPEQEKMLSDTLGATPIEELAGGTPS